LDKLTILFIPSPQPSQPAQSLEKLGLLGRMARNYAIFEPFRNPVSKSEIRSCIGKLFDVHEEFTPLLLQFYSYPVRNY
ncbi:MAG: hypothetical protein ACKPCI_00045, partial [Dolichospermum sp.]